MEYCILEFGAVGDGKSLNTTAIQQAVDQCYRQGGGKVVVPAGTFLTGTVELKSNVFLELTAGAVLLGSPHEPDYRKCFPAVDSVEKNSYDSPFNRDQHLIFALGARHTGIVGPGRIEANGQQFYDPAKMRTSNKNKADGGREFLLKAWRPGATVAFLECRDVTLKDFSLHDNPLFGIEILHSQNVMIDGLYLACDKRFVNGDGIHVKSSREIRIANCNIDVEDDALCFYTDCWLRDGAEVLDMDYSCCNIVVTNCILSSACSGIRIGFMGNDPIRNLQFSNLIVRQAQTAVDILCCGGSSFFCNHAEEHYRGALIENLQFSSLIAENCLWGITFNVSDTAPGVNIRNVQISNALIRSTYGNYFAGMPENPVENVLCRDCRFEVAGGETVPIPEQLGLFKAKGHDMGFLFRNARNCTMESCTIAAKAPFDAVITEACQNVRWLQ